MLARSSCPTQRRSCPRQSERAMLARGSLAGREKIHSDHRPVHADRHDCWRIATTSSDHMGPTTGQKERINPDQRPVHADSHDCWRFVVTFSDRLGPTTGQHARINPDQRPISRGSPRLLADRSHVVGSFGPRYRPKWPDQPGSPRINGVDPPPGRGSTPRSRGSPRVGDFNKYNTNIMAKAPGHPVPPPPATSPSEF